MVIITLELFTLEGDTWQENTCFHTSCVICLFGEWILIAATATFKKSLFLRKPFIWAKSGIDWTYQNRWFLSPAQCCYSAYCVFLETRRQKDKNGNNFVRFDLTNLEFHITSNVFSTRVDSFTAATHMVLSQAANHIWIRQKGMSFLVSHGTINASWLCDVLSAWVL